MGAAFGGLGGFGAGLGTIGQCSTAINTLFNISSVISVGMQSFDMLALGDMTMMRLSQDLGFKYNGGQIAAANAKAHSNPFYNAVQMGTGMTAAFTGGYKSTAKCFIAGTLVLTANGVVAIEMIKAGDLVYAADADTLEVSLKPVLETYIRETSHLVHITINGEEIVSTFDHPYFVKGQGFVNAVDLCIGYELINNKGNVLTIEQIYREVLDNESEKVYNFKVEEDHTYFVGEKHILVHNAGDLYARGKFRKPTHEKMKAEAPRDADGDMICPTCGKKMPETITRNGRSRVGYDGDHYPTTWNERVQEMKKWPTAPTRKQVLDIYNQDVRAQCPDCNQGHRFEGVKGDFA